MEKVKCKKYPKAFSNSMSREQEIRVRELCKHQGIKPAMKQTSAEVRIAALEAQLGIKSQPKKGDDEKEEKTLKEPAWGRKRGNSVVTCKAGKCKEPG